MADQFTDKEITCTDCGGPFVFTAGEQAFFKAKSYTDPKRCKPCRDAKKQQGQQAGGGGNRFDSRGNR
jgi:hypothetical protein